MNLTKRVKGFLISSLFTLAAVCGAAFGLTYKSAAVKAADGLSNDIQKIIDDMNANGKTQGFSAEYVQNVQVQNAAEGATVSGVRVTYTTASDAREKVSGFFDGNGLSATEKAIGIVFDKPLTAANYMYIGFGDIHDTEYYQIINVNNDDSSENPQTWTSLRYYSPNSSYEYKYGSTFAPYNTQNGVGGSSNAQTTASRGAYTATPFNVYYDNGLNVLLADKVSAEDSKVLLLYNVSPSDYANYTDPVTGNALKSSSKTGVDKIEGFDYNRMQFVTRTYKATGDSFVIASFAGLDLTDKTAAYTASNAPIQLVDYESQLVVNTVLNDGNYVLPAAHLASRITNAYVADFTGTVNIYKGKRSSTAAEYGSYGYAYASAEAELGAAIAIGLKTGSKYSFPEAGDYTLEYVQGDKKLYVDVASVNLSDEVDAVVTAINASSNEYASGGKVAATYVKDYNYNGVKISGIKVTVSGLTDSLYLPLLVKISDLTYADNTIGYFVTPENQGANDMAGLHAYVVSADKQRAIAVEHVLDSDNADTETSPRASTNVRVFQGGLKGGTSTQFGLYNPSSSGYGFGIRGIRGVSLKGYAKTPFNVKYDSKLNAVFGDISSSNGHATGTGTEFMRAFAVSPTDYANYADPKTGKKLIANPATGNSTYSAFTGLGEYAYVGFRVVLNSDVESASFILTSYGGLDLTDPTATCGNVLSALNGQEVYKNSVNKQVELPEAKTVNALTGEDSGNAFSGAVTVYKGAREDKYVKYGSWGAETLAFPVEGGEAANGLTYLGVAENGVYTFDEAGYYTLIFASDSGETEIKEIYLSAKTYTLRLNAFNATLTDKGGNVIADGDEVYSGQTLKAVPNDGYTLYGMGGTANAILVGDENNSANASAYGNYRTLTNGAYTIQEGDESAAEPGVIDIGVAAYNEKYNIKFIKNNAEDGNNLSDYRNIEVYKGVPAGYSVDGRLYCVYNPTVFKPTNGVARWNNNFGWDGEKLLLINSYNWPYSTDANDPYKAVQAFGYKITYAEGSAQQSAIYEIGGNGSPVIDSDVTVEAAFIRSFVDYSSAKIETDGTIGLSVRLGINKADYDRLIRMTDGDDISLDFYAVVTTGETLDELGDYRKDAFHVTTDSKNYVKTELNRDNLVTETINGKNYYVFDVKGINIPKENYAKDYVFGGYISYSSPNGGQVVRFGQGGEEFEKINVYTAAKNTFGEGGAIINTESGANVYEINGLKYYSDTLSPRGIYFAVKYYYIGSYLTYVTETETAGYKSVEIGGKTYWYGESAPDDIVRAIKFCNGLSLAEKEA